MHSLGRALTTTSFVPKGANLTELFSLRCISASSRNASSAEAAVDERQEAKAKKMKQAVQSDSFVQNIFRGIVEPVQAFPYPKTLNTEQKETIEMLVPITQRFFVEQNEPLKNDADAKVPENVVQVNVVLL